MNLFKNMVFIQKQKTFITEFYFLNGNEEDGAGFTSHNLVS
jgi:hypothetical protein